MTVDGAYLTGVLKKVSDPTLKRNAAMTWRSFAPRRAPQMNRLSLTCTLAIAVLIGASGVAFAQGERGSFGFVVNIEGDGFFLNPTIRAVTIEKVVPESPAAKGRIAVGDKIIEVDGIAIGGRKAKELEPLVQKSIGETLHLRLKRPNGAYYNVDLVAVAQPRES